MIYNVCNFAVLSVHAAVTSCAVIQVNKHELVAHLGIPFRDLRILDPSVRPHHVRPHFVSVKELLMIFPVFALICLHPS